MAMRTRVAQIAYTRALADHGHGCADIQANATTLEVEPTGVRLDNDGCYRHWIRPGIAHRLGWDGTGWRMTAEGWDDTHVFRLADVGAPKGTFVSWLPLSDGGRINLEPAQVYMLELGPSDDWKDGAVLHLSTV